MLKAVPGPMSHKDGQVFLLDIQRKAQGQGLSKVTKERQAH